jgi:tRNAThr (cytosine32-N3)-methyltransferase
VTEEPGAVKFTSPEPEPEPGRVVVTPTIIDDDPFKDREPEHPSSTIIHPNLLLVEKQSSSPSSSSPSSPSSVPRFSIEQLGVDRRLIVNRKRQLKMYRVWMQGKFCKTG